MRNQIGILALVLGLSITSTGSATAQVPGSNGRVVYSQASDSSLVIINADGTNSQRLGLFGLFPEWSPTRGEIAYWNSGSIVLFNLESGQATTLTSGVPSSTAPSWSPSGDQLATTVAGSLKLVCVHPGAECTTDSMAYEPSGSCSRVGQRFPDFGTLCASGPAAWSPGGTTVAWVSINSSGQYQLQLMRPDGSNRRSIYTSPAGGADPSVSLGELNWHPSSQFLSFYTVEYSPGPVEIERSIALDGTFVDNTPGVRGHWAPDGVSSVYTAFVTDAVSGYTTWVRNGSTSAALPTGGAGSAGVGASWERTASSTPTCVAAMATGMIGWWRGGDNAVGTVGPTLLGTVVGGVGVSGGALNFDGTTQLEATNLAAPSKAVTVEAWVKPAADDPLVRTVMSRWDFPSTDDSARAYTLQLLPTGHVVWTTDETSARRPEELRSPKVRLDDGTFHHIAATWDQFTMAVYIDGALVASKPSQGGTLNPAPTTPFRLGGEVRGFVFKGAIDEPTVYSRSLTAGEVHSIYTAGSLAKCT